MAGGSAHLEKTGQDHSSLASEILVFSRGRMAGFILSISSNWLVVAA